MISKRYNAQMGNYLAKLAQEQNNLGTWQESIIKEYKTKQTNADRIRSMSDEELANWITSIDQDAPCPPDGSCSCVKSNCVKGWLNWLQEEAKS